MLIDRWDERMMKNSYLFNVIQLYICMFINFLFLGINIQFSEESLLVHLPQSMGLVINSTLSDVVQPTLKISHFESRASEGNITQTSCWVLPRRVVDTGFCDYAASESSSHVSSICLGGRQALNPTKAPESPANSDSGFSGE